MTYFAEPKEEGFQLKRTKVEQKKNNHNLFLEFKPNNDTFDSLKQAFTLAHANIQ